MAAIATRTGAVPAGRPRRRTWPEALHFATRRPQLRRSVTIAVLIGSLFVGINQLPLVLSGHADLVLILKAALTYLTPFLVSTYGQLAATRNVCGR